MQDYKSNIELLAEYNKHVKGHIEAKKAIINLVNRSKMRYYRKFKALDENYNILEPNKLLLIGNSGTGKTFLVEIASKLMNFPFIKIDATMMSAIGRSDGITQNDLKNAIADSAKHLVQTNKAYYSEEGTIDQMVVFIDEIDKLARICDSTGNWNRHIQESFLTMFEDKDEFAGVSFIFAGAFSGMEKQLVKASTIGFNSTNESSSSSTEVDWDQQVIDYGLVPELVGRLTGIHKLDTLTKDDYKEILHTMLLPKKKEQMLYYNYTDLELSTDRVDAMIEKAFKSGQGVRALKRELDKVLADLEFNYEVNTDQALKLEHIKNRYDLQSE